MHAKDKLEIETCPVVVEKIIWDRFDESQESRIVIYNLKFLVPGVFFLIVCFCFE